MSGSPVADEAAKLVEALQDWVAGATGGLPLASGSAECALCPFCQLLRAARSTRPEVFEHLAGAGAELVAALRAGMDGRRAADSAGHSRVEHIKVSD